MSNLSPISRAEVLSFLDVESPGLLPQTCKIDCPRCRNTLLIYQNTTRQLDWAYCEGCFPGGDLYHFVADALEIPVQRLLSQVIVKFQHNIGSDDFDEYLSQVEHDRRLLEWVDSLVQPLSQNSRVAAQALAAADFRHVPSPRFWQSRVGRMVGVAERGELLSQLVDLGFPGDLKKWLPRRTRSEIFLVLPVFGAHEFLAGLLVLDPADRHKLAYASAGETLQLGLAGSTLNYQQFDLGAREQILILDDPWKALELQLRHCRDNPAPLPLFVVPPISSRSAARAERPSLPLHFAESYPVFVPALRSPELVEWAIRDDRRLLLYADAIDDSHPGRWVSAAYNAAERWDSVLDLEICTPTSPAIDNMVANLRIDTALLERAKSKLSNSAFRRLVKLRDAQKVDAVVVEGREVLQANQRWYTKGQRTQISDFVVRIDRLLQQTATKQRYCLGAIEYHERTISFFENANELKESLLSWAQDRILEQYNEYAPFTKSWDRRAFDVAMAFSRPEIVHVQAVTGWIPGKNVVELGKYYIDESGVQQSRLPAAPSECRAVASLFDIDLTEPAVQKVLETLDKPLMTMLVAVLGQIVGYISSNRPPMVLLSGEHAESIMLEFLPKLGIPVLPPNRVRTLGQLEELAELHKPHNWPTAFRSSPASLRLLKDWIFEHAVAGLITSIPDSWVHWASTARHHIVVDLANTQPPSETEYQALLYCWRRLLAGLVKDADEIQQEYPTRTLTSAVYQQRAKRFAGRVNRLMRFGYNIWHLDEVARGKAPLLIQALYKEICSGTLQFDVDERYAPSKKTIWHVLNRDPQAVWISKYVMDYLRDKKKLPVPPDSQITGLFYDAGALLDRRYSTESGWLISFEKWEKAIRESIASESTNVRIAR